MEYKFSKHALEQMENRGIPINLTKSIIENPNQVIKRNDIWIYQSVETIKDKQYLFRIFVNMAKSPKLVMTLYRTSKIQKYYESKV